MKKYISVACIVTYLAMSGLMVGVYPPKTAPDFTGFEDVESAIWMGNNYDVNTFLGLISEPLTEFDEQALIGVLHKLWTDPESFTQSDYKELLETKLGFTAMREIPKDSPVYKLAKELEDYVRYAQKNNGKPYETYGETLSAQDADDNLLVSEIDRDLSLLGLSKDVSAREEIDSAIRKRLDARDRVEAYLDKKGEAQGVHEKNESSYAKIQEMMNNKEDFDNNEDDLLLLKNVHRTYPIKPQLSSAVRKILDVGDKAEQYVTRKKEIKALHENDDLEKLQAEHEATGNRLKKEALKELIKAKQERASNKQTEERTHDMAGF